MRPGQEELQTEQWTPNVALYLWYGYLLDGTHGGRRFWCMKLKAKHALNDLQERQHDGQAEAHDDIATLEAGDESRFGWRFQITARAVGFVVLARIEVWICFYDPKMTVSGPTWMGTRRRREFVLADLGWISNSLIATPVECLGGEDGGTDVR